jgi:hypothetical protein
MEGEENGASPPNAEADAQAQQLADRVIRLRVTGHRTTPIRSSATIDRNETLPRTSGLNPGFFNPRREAVSDPVNRGSAPGITPGFFNIRREHPPTSAPAPAPLNSNIPERRVRRTGLRQDLINSAKSADKTLKYQIQSCEQQ